MANSNGKITAPVGVDTDIPYVLGIGSYDVGTQCTSPNINDANIYKPIQSTKLEELTRQDFVNSKLGWVDQTPSADLASRRMVYAKPHTNFRVLDFNGYDHFKKDFANITLPSSLKPLEISYIEIDSLVKWIDDRDCGIRDCYGSNFIYLGVRLKSLTTGESYIQVVKSPTKKIPIILAQRYYVGIGDKIWINWATFGLKVQLTLFVTDNWLGYSNSGEWYKTDKPPQSSAIFPLVVFNINNREITKNYTLSTNPIWSSRYVPTDSSGNVDTNPVLILYPTVASVFSSYFTVYLKDNANIGLDNLKRSTWQAFVTLEDGGTFFTETGIGNYTTKPIVSLGNGRYIVYFSQTAIYPGPWDYGMKCRMCIKTESGFTEVFHNLLCYGKPL